MGKYVCMDCYEIFNDEFTPKKYDIGQKFSVSYCPKGRCEGQLIEVDDNMIGIIIELNKIGLTTAFCCGGHVGTDETDIYIAFGVDIEADMLGDIPYGFELEDKDVVFDKVCIRATIKDKSLDLLWQQKEINRLIDVLIKWVEERKLELDTNDDYWCSEEIALLF